MQKNIYELCILEVFWIMQSLIFFYVKVISALCNLEFAFRIAQCIFFLL